MYVKYSYINVGIKTLYATGKPEKGWKQSGNVVYFFQMDKLAIGAQLFKEKREKQKNRQIDNQIKIKSRTYSNREIRAEKNIKKSLQYNTITYPL